MALDSFFVRNKVVAILSGGLGNQLFQYATAKAVAMRTKSILVLDLSWFRQPKFRSNITPRKYALESFKFPTTLVNHTDKSGVLNKCISIVSESFFNRSIGYSEKSYNFDPKVKSLRAPVRLKGYWQSYKYFEEYAEIIKSEIGEVRSLSEKSASLLNKIKHTQSICLHIRRGDYVSNPTAASFHGQCSLKYYREGIKIVAKGFGSPHAFVFSDDPRWVSENLDIGIDCTVVDINGPDEAQQDLWLMSACSRFVIANSSLSWWAAWLSNSSDKIVVAPKFWFTSTDIDTTDLIPNDWIRI